MSASAYAKWDAYNVESSLAEVDEQSLIDDRDRVLRKLSEKQSDYEGKEIVVCLEEAEALESVDAVRVLKGVRKGRRKRNVSESAVPVPVPVPVEQPSHPAHPAHAESEALASSRRAVLRGNSLRDSCRYRESGKTLAKAGDFSAAFLDFMAGHSSLDVYEDNLDPVISVTDSNEVVSTKVSSRDVCCGPSSAKLKEQQDLVKPSPLQPTQANLNVAVRRDLNLNTGRCLLSLDKYSEAADSLKDVLLVDPGNVHAWVARGECYRKMNLYTLADLHLIKATDIDDVDVNAKKVKALNDADLIRERTRKILNGAGGGVDGPNGLNGGVDGGIESGEDATESMINNIVHSNMSAKDILSMALKSYKEGVVIFREQFFNTAASKYEYAANAVCAAERIMNVPLPEAINGVRIASYLGVAACCLLRKRDIMKAERYCSAAIRCEKRNVTAYLRRSEARIEINDFDGAVRDLKECRRIVGGGRRNRNVSSDTGAWSGKEMALKDIERRLKRAEYTRKLCTGECSWD
jgi:tetratricopeptide (TPR) repeat protein